MIDSNNLEQLRFHTETQLFDRKSARIEPKALANLIIAFANADGGDAVIGIEDDGTVTGINGQEKKSTNYSVFLWTTASPLSVLILK